VILKLPLKRKKAQKLSLNQLKIPKQESGYSSVGYKSDNVKVVPINSKGNCFDPSFENTYSRKYPLARGLFVYILKDPKNSMDPIAGEFIKYILSKDGQSFCKACRILSNYQ